MARFLVTINFTRNAAAEQFITSVPPDLAASATAAETLAVNQATQLLDAKASAAGDTVVIGTSAVIAE